METVLYIAIGFKTIHPETAYILSTAKTKQEADKEVLKQIKLGNITYGKTLKATTQQ